MTNDFALGLVLSSIVIIEYNCDGPEMFPTFYGSPFVFKRKSLASSMEFYFSISGLTLNVLAWSCLLFLIDLAMVKLIQRIPKKKLSSVAYKVGIGFMLLFSTLNIVAEFTVMRGRGFREQANYWYWNMDKEAKDWGMTCKGELKIL